ncbi:MAG: hypothetical protein H7X95_10955, partial [Deltaproteobacteria bacterium]|nr:hypothetical protein [Deltaproteobacteria bacterium]
MSQQFQAWLLREGAIGETALRAAVARQQIYGGGLDTAILDRQSMTEADLWARLAAATGLPVPG